MKLQDAQLLLYAALVEPIGLLLQTNDFARARQVLYRARAETSDPALAVLQFRASPGLAGGNLLIVKQKIELDGRDRESEDAEATPV